MAEAVGSAFLEGCERLAASSWPETDPEKKTPRNARRFHIDQKFLPNYFDTDFLNARSIFSLVASQQAWLA
jgi:hypothetical protein